MIPDVLSSLIERGAFESCVSDVNLGHEHRRLECVTRLILVRRRTSDSFETRPLSQNPISCSTSPPPRPSLRSSSHQTNRSSANRIRYILRLGEDSYGIICIALRLICFSRRITHDHPMSGSVRRQRFSYCSRKFNTLANALLDEREKSCMDRARMNNARRMQCIIH